MLKTGKEADVHLICRALSEDGPSTLFAAKRYRDADHRLFTGIRSTGKAAGSASHA